MTTVRDLMSSDVISVTPDLTLRSALELLAARHIGGAPVMAGSRVVGVVSMSDILSFQSSTAVVPGHEPDQMEWEQEPGEAWQEGDDAPAAFFTDLWVDAGAEVGERFEQTGGPEWDLLAEHTVAEAMSRRVVSVGPDTSPRAAARLMTRLELHRLLVLDQGRLCGVLSAMDLVRAVGEGRI